MKTYYIAVALAGAIANSAIAQTPQAPAQSTPRPVGTWRGTSVCLVRPSACHDETTVYRITMKTADSLAIDGRRIVNGEEQEMGVLGCHLVPQSGDITCTIPQGVWRFRVHNDSLTGELRKPDNTRTREVRAIRAP